MNNKECNWEDVCKFKGREHEKVIGDRRVYFRLRNQYRSFVCGTIKVYKKGGNILHVIVHCFIFILDYATLCLFSTGLAKALMF